MIKFTLIGGDKRMVYLANILNDEGSKICTYGIDCKDLNPSIKKKRSLKEAMKFADIIISPLPFSYDNNTVNCEYFNEEIKIEDIYKNMSEKQLMFAGFIKEEIRKLANNYNVNCYDYFECEELTILNCIPTAEGAIKIAIEELPNTLHGSKCLILGFGRIGKILSKMLNGIGAKVTVEARKQSDFAWIRSYGYDCISLNDLKDRIEDYDVIFNTIPVVILDENILKQVNKNALIIDLASKPGGVDFEAAKKLDIKTIWALGLPGKVAPYTAAIYIKETIFNVLNEKGVNINA